MLRVCDSVCVGAARRGMGVCCGPAFSRVKRDFPVCSQWECDRQSALLLTSYQLTREHMPVSANWWLALYERVCVSVCVQQALAKRFVWASAGSTGHSSFPALEPALDRSHACNSQ